MKQLVNESKTGNENQISTISKFTEETSYRKFVTYVVVLYTHSIEDIL